MTRTLAEWVQSARLYPDLFRCTWNDAAKLCAEIASQETAAGEPVTDREEVSGAIDWPGVWKDCDAS